VQRFVRRYREDLSRRGQRVDDLEDRLRRRLEQQVAELKHRTALSAQAVKMQSPLLRLERNQTAAADLQRRLLYWSPRACREQRHRLVRAERELLHRAPLYHLREARRDLAEQTARLPVAWQRRMGARREGLRVCEEVLRTLNPRAMLQRGYGIVTRPRGRKALTRARQLDVGESFKVLLHRGTIHAQVLGVQEELPLFPDETADPDTTTDEKDTD
jgi:exodeoxyribonuclease VII large subunit